jgi:tyrosine-protein phosphatase SIW14
MIIKLLLILSLFVVELPPTSLLGKASRSVGAVLSSMCIYLKPLSMGIDRWILKEDLSNFKVVSEGVYRGGQPLGDGYKLLKFKGIKKIINLRGIDTGEHLGIGFNHVHIPIHAHYPEKEDVVAFLKAINESEGEAIFIHCFHGSDRTGLFVAIYRVVYEGWSKERALEEMVHGGHGFHIHLQQNLIQFFEALDLEELMQISQGHGLVSEGA